MVALQIRDVPEEVRETLAAQARGRGQSMQAYLLELVEAEARRAGNAVLLNRLDHRRGGVRSSPGELAELIGVGRQERETTSS